MPNVTSHWITYYSTKARLLVLSISLTFGFWKLSHYEQFKLVIGYLAVFKTRSTIQTRIIIFCLVWFFQSFNPHVSVVQLLFVILIKLVFMYFHSFGNFWIPVDPIIDRKREVTPLAFNPRNN